MSRRLTAVILALVAIFTLCFCGPPQPRLPLLVPTVVVDGVCHSQYQKNEYVITGKYGGMYAFEFQIAPGIWARDNSTLFLVPDNWQVLGHNVPEPFQVVWRYYDAANVEHWAVVADEHHETSPLCPIL